MKDVRSGIIDFLKGLNLPIDALGTGSIALLKDVRSGITDFGVGGRLGGSHGEVGVYINKE